MRFNYNVSFTVERLAAYSGNKSSFASVAGTLRGYFTPIEPSQKTAALGIIGQAFELYTDGPKDVRVADNITINSVKYGVRGAVRYQNAGQDFLKLTLELMTTA